MSLGRTDKNGARNAQCVTTSSNVPVCGICTVTLAGEKETKAKFAVSVAMNTLMIRAGPNIHGDGPASPQMIGRAVQPPRPRPGRHDLHVHYLSRQPQSDNALRQGKTLTRGGQSITGDNFLHHSPPPGMHPTQFCGRRRLHLIIVSSQAFEERYSCTV